MNKQQVLREVYAGYLLLWLIVTSRYPLGTNVYKLDWDLLVVLDTCRIDALQEIKGEYDFLNKIGSRWSVGSTSKEWIEQTFVNEFQEKIRGTAYITGNPFSDTLAGKRKTFDYGATTEDTWLENSDILSNLIRSNMVSQTNFGHIEFLKTGEFRTINPRPITDHTVKAARSEKFDRTIAHYMQPHTPYYSSSNTYDELVEYEKYPFKAIRNGKTTKKEVWDAYLDNLRYVLDDIKLLLNNVDGEVIITADHGELFGEWGMYYHHAGNIHPAVKKVPWVRAEATNMETHNPEVELKGETIERMTDEQLEALGYLN